MRRAEELRLRLISRFDQINAKVTVYSNPDTLMCLCMVQKRLSHTLPTGRPAVGLAVLPHAPRFVTRPIQSLTDCDSTLCDKTALSEDEHLEKILYSTDSTQYALITVTVTRTRHGMCR